MISGTDVEGSDHMHLPGVEARTVIDTKIYEEISKEFNEEELNRIVRYSFERGGKRCRAILLLLSIEATAGRRSSTKCSVYHILVQNQSVKDEFVLLVRRTVYDYG